jgi:hypothetical protein
MAAGEHRVGWNASTKRFMYLHGHVRTDAASMVAVQLQLEDKKMVWYKDILNRIHALYVQHHTHTHEQNCLHFAEWSNRLWRTELLD